MARDWIFDFIDGSNSNGGTSLIDALKDHQAAAWAYISNGDRLLFQASASVLSHYRPLAGGSDLSSWRGPALSGKTDLRIQPYGDVKPVFRGDCTLSAAVWVQIPATNAYTTVVDFGATAPSGVTFGYDSSTQVLGGESCHYGVIAGAAASALAVQSADHSFFYDTTTDTLTINLGGVDPNSGVVTAVCGGDANMMSLTSMTGCRMTGIVARLTTLKSSGGGYCRAWTGCVDCVDEDGEAWDGGNHNLGCIGNFNRNNRIVRAVVGGGDTTSTLIVQYLADNTQKLEGTRVVDSKAVVYNHLKPDGNPNVAAAVVTGYFTHAVSSDRVITDLEFRGCYAACVPFTSAGVKGYGAASNIGVYTGDRMSTQGRPLRFIDCRSTGDTSFTLPGPALVQRCRFDFANAGPNNSGGSTGIIRTQTDGGGTDIRCRMLFDSCDFMADLANATSQKFVLPSSASYAAGEGPTFLGCSFTDYGADTGTSVMIGFNSKTNFGVVVRGCVFAYLLKSSTRAQLCATDNVAAALHDFQACDYVGISSTSYSANASFNADTEWMSLIDTRGRALTVAQAALASAAAGGSGLPAGSSLIYNGAGAQDVRARLDVRKRLAQSGRGAWRRADIGWDR